MNSTEDTHSVELRDRAIRMALEARQGTPTGPIQWIVDQLGTFPKLCGLGFVRSISTTVFDRAPPPMTRPASLSSVNDGRKLTPFRRLKIDPHGF